MAQRVEDDGRGGDANKIIDAKRPDVPFFLITDGITWMRRINDLRKLVKLQNEGRIEPDLYDGDGGTSLWGFAAVESGIRTVARG
jgi:hypothetical protein